jgi:hypothetical protein
MRYDVLNQCQRPQNSFAWAFLWPHAMRKAAIEISCNPHSKECREKSQMNSRKECSYVRMDEWQPSDASNVSTQLQQYSRFPILFAIAGKVLHKFATSSDFARVLSSCSSRIRFINQSLAVISSYFLPFFSIHVPGSASITVVMFGLQEYAPQ